MRTFTKDGGIKFIEDGSNSIPLVLAAGWTEKIETPKIVSKKNGDKTITTTI